MKRCIALLLLFLSLSFSASAADYCDCTDPEAHLTRQQAFDTILREYNTVGASIALISGGRIVDTFQFGKANRADNIPVDSETYFRIASVTKMMSAAGLLHLVETGRLSLDADLSDYFGYPVRNPHFPNTPITLRQVMTHTATLKDDFHYQRATRGDITLLRHVLNGNYTVNNYFRREPGTFVYYSNFGGGLLGSLIEEMTGYTVDEYMQARIYYPLNLYGGYHTPCLPKGATVARIYAVGPMIMTLDPQSKTDEHWDPDPDRGYVHTAGAGLMTAEGLAKLLIALAGDGSVDGVEILQPETVRMMRERQDHIGSVTCDSERGLNLNIIKDRLVNGRTLYGHQGKAYGMICAAYFDPTDQTGVVLLTNGCDTATVDSVAKIARAIMTQAYKYLP